MFEVYRYRVESGVKGVIFLFAAGVAVRRGRGKKHTTDPRRECISRDAGAISGGECCYGAAAGVKVGRGHFIITLLEKKNYIIYY